MPLPRPSSADPKKLYQWATQFVQAMETGKSIILPLALIDTQTLLAAAASVTFQVPQDFSHLFLIANQESSSGATGSCWRANGDSGTGYFWEEIDGIGAGVNAGGAASVTSARFSVAWGVGNPSASFTVFPAYRVPLLKRSLSVMTGYDGANLNTRVLGSLWQSTAPITSLTLLQDTGVNFVANSTFSLYGLR